MATSPSDSRLGTRSESPSIGTVSRGSFVNPSSIPASLSLNTASPRFFTVSSHSVLTPSGVVSDGFPPSGAHASSPHTSQAGGPLYYSGHMTGSWSTPGLSQPSSYTYGTSGSGTSGSGPLAQPPYSRTPAPYGSAQSPSHHHFPGRATSSAQNAESIPAPQSYQDQQPFPSPVGVGGAGNGSGSLGSPLSAQGGNQSGLAQPILGNQTHNITRQAAPGQNTGGGPVTTQDGGSYRQPPTPSGYYPHTSAPQQPPFSSYAPPGTQPSPTSASSATTPGSVPRGASSIPAMAPPLQYSGGRANSVPSMPSYASYNTGPVLSNMHHPGAPLAMVGSMSGLPSYSHHPGLPPHHPHPLYVHHPGGPTPQSERPFKCNECQQAFNRNHDLKRHQRIHLAVKPFGCGDCEKRFSRKDALKRHRLVKGCGGTSPPSAAGTNTGSKEVTSDDRGAIASADKDTSPRSMKREP
ncbi:zinc finger C2H2-like protein [Corynascus novoguineensis]|uniref:Zinc finger C2H2-like protein n=1 Tax=Corynascus novoguineensis TaxID=1126955 RepID=A0AAN7CVW0_9PEZI|nr:zinc finger C2H2-like protein [Corynascus novoguineensis]